MDAKAVKDLTVSLDEYAVVPEDETILEALNALEDHPDRPIPYVW